MTEHQQAIGRSRVVPSLSIFDRFVRWNIRMCGRLSPALEARTHPYPRFNQLVADFVGNRDQIALVDIGAGRSCDYAARVDRSRIRRVVGVDVSAEELALNGFLDERIVADACLPLPELEGQSDLLVSRATIEHLPDNAAFLRNAARILKPGGTIMLVFANRYAPFALLNRMLPHKVSGLLLAKLAPYWAGQVGFEAHYDRCNGSAFRRLLAEAGYVDVDLRTGYFSSSYFRFFVPLYLVSLAFDSLRHLLQIEDLASYYLIVARTPETRSA